MIQLKTSWALSEGKFDVFPKTGVAGKDTFKISYTVKFGLNIFLELEY